MQFEKWTDLDISKGRAAVMDLGPILFSGDNHALKLGVHVYNGTEPVTVTGSVAGSAIIANGQTITPFVTGKDGNAAWVEVPQAALVCQGRIEIFLRVSEDDEIAVSLYATGTVKRTTTGEAVNPGTVIPDIGTAVQECVDATAAATAAADDATAAASHAVRYDAAQTLTDEQKTQARTNIGAASEAEHFPATGKLQAGIGTSAAANGAVATGVGTTASGRASHAEGQLTTADGQVAHAEGYGTTASGDYSHAEGFGTVASGDHQHASGKYNVEDPNGTYAEVVGNGTGDNARSNARTLDWNGNEALAGDLTVNKGTASEMAVSAEVSSLKSAFNRYLSGDLPFTIIKDEYVKTDGAVGSYTGWDRTDYIPVGQYYGVYLKTSVASGYNCWYDANKQKVGNTFNVTTVGRVVTIPDGAVYLMMSNSAAGMQNLEARYVTNVAQDVANTSDAVSDIKKAMDGYSLVTYSLPADSTVGTNWNNTYDMAIPAGSRLIIRFNGYSGTNFTRFAVFGNKTGGSSTELKTFYTNTAAEIEIVTAEAYTGLYLSLVRSAAESPVEYSISVKADIGTMLGHDILSLTEQAAGLAESDAYINANLSGIAYAHFNLFDMCVFDDGYVYNAAGAKVEVESNSVATPIRVEAGTTYYAKNTRLYFSFFIYEDGTSARIGDSDSVTSGAFVPTKAGYAYLTVVTGNKANCVFTEDQTLYESSRTATYYIPNKLELGIEGNHIFHVGTGRDYTSLLEGIIAAEQFKNSIVYVDPGTYDMVQEFKDKYGSGFFTAENYLTQENHRGCPLTNGVHVIGYGGVTVTGGLQSTDSQDAIGDWSIFSAGDDAGGDNGYGFTLENITIKSTSQHIRYLVHDEYGLTNYNYINKYLNIHFIVFPGYVKRCIGGGLGSHGYILIDNCTISAPAYDATIRGINYHNDANTGALNEIYIKNCYIPNGTVGITWYGQTPATEKSMLYVNNCYLQAEPVKKAETESAPYENVDIVSWCNTIAP